VALVGGRPALQRVELHALDVRTVAAHDAQRALREPAECAECTADPLLAASRTPVAEALAELGLTL
jgi:hypothetical protein